jgi:hypothetical protein
MRHTLKGMLALRLGLTRPGPKCPFFVCTTLIANRNRVNQRRSQTIGFQKEAV